MRYTESDEELRRENLELRRQLQELRRSHDGPAPTGQRWRPSGAAITAIVLGALALVVIAFFAGYIPYQKQRALIVDEAQQREQALPRVNVFEVSRAGRNTALELPGNIQAITEAPILARSEGYIKSRLVDLGDRVRAGQPLAEIDAPELDEQVRQAKASLDQAKAGLDQATANLQQGKSELEIARLAAQRWGVLVQQGAVSRMKTIRLSSSSNRGRRLCSRWRRLLMFSGVISRRRMRISRVCRGWRSIAQFGLLLMA